MDERKKFLADVGIDPELAAFVNRICDAPEAFLKLTQEERTAWEHRMDRVIAGLQ